MFEHHSIQDINWTYTKAWQHHNDTPDVCSSDTSKKQSFKIKSLNHILPYGDVLSAQSFYSRNLLPIKCPLCGHTDDDNQHLGFCPDLTQPLMGVLKDAKDLIYKRLTSELNTFYTNSTLSRDLESTPLFSPVTDANHPVYLIIHSVVPQSLVDLIHSKSSHTSSIVMDVMKLIHSQFSTHVWKRHMVLWEKRTGIHTKKIKMRRAKRRANNKREKRKRIVREQLSLFPCHRTFPFRRS